MDRPAEDGTFTTTQYQIKYSATKQKDGLFITADHLIDKTKWSALVTGLPVATGLDLCPDRLLKIFRGDFKGSSLLYQQASGEALTIRIVINNDLLDAPAQLQICLNEKEVPEVEKLKLVIEDLRQELAMVKETQKLELLQASSVVSGVTTHSHIMQTGTDYNNAINTHTDANTFTSMELKEACFVNAAKFRMYCGDTRTYTIQCEISEDGANWMPLVQNLAVVGLGTIVVQQRIKAIRFKGTNTINAFLHFIMFKLI